MFVLAHSNTDNPRRYTVQRNYLPRGVTKYYNAIVNEKTITNDSDIKWYEEIRELTTKWRLYHRMFIGL